MKFRTRSLVLATTVALVVTLTGLATSALAAKPVAGQYALDLILRQPGVGGLNGGKFQLKNSAGQTVFNGETSTVGAAGTICVDSLPAGTYTWIEIKPPKGYVNTGPASQSVTTASEPGSCTTGLGGFGITIFDNVPAT